MPARPSSPAPANDASKWPPRRPPMRQLPVTETSPHPLPLPPSILPSCLFSPLSSPHVYPPLLSGLFSPLSSLHIYTPLLSISPFPISLTHPLHPIPLFLPTAAHPLYLSQHTDSSIAGIHEANCMYPHLGRIYHVQNIFYYAHFSPVFFLSIYLFVCPSICLSIHQIFITRS